MASTMRSSLTIPGLHAIVKVWASYMLSKGASMVLLTAPGKGDIPNIVFGVNHEEYNAENEKIFCCQLYHQCSSSCHPCDGEHLRH